MSFIIINIKANKNHTPEKTNQTNVASLNGKLENENIASKDRLIIFPHEYHVFQYILSFLSNST
jgi:hypothetical protein